ncbi:serine hydrolase domain-containing protein [Streptomyces sp. NPDC093252]|uniref:serine hydrolase domain-containing protein n=1 Tax=Streptomyces sp. NPDC093252 TaxID=3154980 RepID=UPI003444793F
MPKSPAPRRRSAVVAVAASALALTLGAGATATPAAARPAVPQCAASADRGPDIAGLTRELAALPDAVATAATLRLDGDCAWSEADGLRNVRTGAPALENGRFRAGSVTKVVTAAVVLRLVAEGRIDLDGTVQEYLPGLLTEDFGPITVRQLLNYTSGLRAGAAQPGGSVDESYPHRFETVTPEEVVAASVAAGPEAPAGWVQRYGNISYTVLGMVVEEVTGQSYARLAERLVFRPLGMRHSSFPAGTDPRVPGPHNRGYDVIDGKLTDVTEWNMADRWAAGDLISTAADLERLIEGLFGGRLLPEPLLDQMLTVPEVEQGTARYGMAFERLPVGKVEYWVKSGSRPGYATAVVATRDLSRTFVYSVNATDAKDDSGAVPQRFGLPALRP